MARFDFLRSPDSEWQSNFKRQFPAGACWSHVIEHLLRCVVFYINDGIINAELVRHSPRLSISRQRHKQCLLTITIHKRHERIFVAWNENTVVLDDQFLALDHPGGPMALVNAMTDRIEKFWARLPTRELTGT